MDFRLLRGFCKNFEKNETEYMVLTSISTWSYCLKTTKTVHNTYKK